VEVDINQLPEKERKKIILQREREATKAKDKADKEAQKAKDKLEKEAKNFGSSLVHDNGMLLLFHKDDLKLRVDIRGYSKAYHFSILKEWMRINRLLITSARDASKIVSGSNLVICIIFSDTCISNLYVADYVPCYIHL
jgi:hypothetical protein